MASHYAQNNAKCVYIKTLTMNSNLHFLKYICIESSRYVLQKIELINNNYFTEMSL
jgi:hypothetical protein